MSPRAPGILACLAALAAAAPARPGEADAFEDKVPPISGQLNPKSGRFEVTPGLNLSVNDSFFTKTFGGLRLGYHLDEHWSFSGSFAAGLVSPTASASICQANQGCSPATAVQLRQVPGKIKWMGGVEGAWAPVYGKLSVLAELPVHFDLAVVVGADYITYQRVQSSAAAQAGAGGDAASPGLHAGLGMRLFLGRFTALRFDVKHYAYYAEIGNLGKKELQGQRFLELGLSFFLPTSVRRSQ